MLLPSPASDKLALLTISQVATQLVALCREDKFVDAVETLYGDGVVSIEALDYVSPALETSPIPPAPIGARIS